MRLLAFQINKKIHDFKSYVLPSQGDDCNAVHDALLALRPGSPFLAYQSHNWASGMPIFVFERENELYLVTDRQIHVAGLLEAFEIVLAVS